MEFNQRFADEIVRKAELSSELSSSGSSFDLKKQFGKKNVSEFDFALFLVSAFEAKYDLVAIVEILLKRLNKSIVEVEYYCDNCQQDFRVHHRITQPNQKHPFTKTCQWCSNKPTIKSITNVF